MKIKIVDNCHFYYFFFFRWCCCCACCCHCVVSIVTAVVACSWVCCYSCCCRCCCCCRRCHTQLTAFWLLCIRPNRAPRQIECIFRAVDSKKKKKKKIYIHTHTIYECRLHDMCGAVADSVAAIVGDIGGATRIHFSSRLQLCLRLLPPPILLTPWFAHLPVFSLIYFHPLYCHKYSEHVSFYQNINSIWV